ncbi:MAG: hypothetical protein NE334_08915 [Lentisphaeraceae bacterium]|nr:hypothetical protein [Lentisphaeraceae bacterium]
MKYFLFFLFFTLVSLGAETEALANEFLKKLDGNYKERKEASAQLKNLPVEFYPFLKKHLETEVVSLEVKLRLTKEKMFPLRAKWLLKKRIDWYRKHTVDAYKDFGHKDERWNEDALGAFELVLKQFETSWWIEEYAEAIEKACKKAIGKGCKDPLILYFHARGSRAKLLKGKYLNILPMHRKAQHALRASKYHDFFKFRSTRLTAYYIKYRKKSIPKYIDPCLSKLKESIPYFVNCFKDKDFPFDDLLHNSNNITDVYRSCGFTHFAGYELFKNELIEAYGENSLEHNAVFGWVNLVEYSYRYSKNIRDMNLANSIELLKRAWEQDPGRLAIAIRILDACRSRGDWSEFNKWYSNVLLADPGSEDAFKKKILFLKRESSIDDWWKYGLEISQSKTAMVRNLPEFLDEFSDYLNIRNDEVLFNFSAFYNEPRFNELVRNAASGEVSDNLLTELAYVSGIYGFWEKAEKLFKRVDDVNSYKGIYLLRNILDIRKESSYYATKKITPQLPPYVDFRERLQTNYQEAKKGGLYNFWDFYKKNNKKNPKWDKYLEPYLKHMSERFYDKPELIHEFKDSYQKPYKKLAEIRKQGNRDPLIFLFWSNLKDYWYMGDDKAQGFFALQQLLDSNYPNSLKVYGICQGVSQLGYQKVVSESEKKLVESIVKILPELIEENSVSVAKYYDLYSGLLALRILDKKLHEPIQLRLEELGQFCSAKIVKAYFHNRMAWQIYYGNNRKNNKETNAHNRLAKASIKDAWFLNPGNGVASSRLLGYSVWFDQDYNISLRRAVYGAFSSNEPLNRYVKDKRKYTVSKSWLKFPYSHNMASLATYEYAKHVSDQDKDNPDRAKRYWKYVKKGFEKHLASYPNDTISKSKYAKFAIRCGEESEARRLLKELGEYAVPWPFGGVDKLEEYRKTYLSDLESTEK